VRGSVCFFFCVGVCVRARVSAFVRACYVWVYSLFIYYFIFVVVELYLVIERVCACVLCVGLITVFIKSYKES
jgi:hypothetical protein